MKQIKSDISGFYKIPIGMRKALISESCNLSLEEKDLLNNLGYFKVDQLDTMIENVIGSYQLPLGIATNFKVNNKDYLIPMVIEEPSVVAAASNAAKMARNRGGFTSDNIKSLMISQVQISQLTDIKQAQAKLEKSKDTLINIANEQDPMLVKLGGGAVNIEWRLLKTRRGSMIILHLIVDVLDAMGANIVNTMAEAISPYIEEITGGNVSLRIVSNLATYRIARSKAIFDKDMLGGIEVVEAILDAYEFAREDPYRATTHNKGVMNGIIALTLATGNDTRAIEAGAHSYAAISGKYTPLTHFTKDENGNLIGSIELPLAMGIIGGMTKVHPMARLALKILNVTSANELGQVTAALGLAQNVAALRALVSEGIQKGHMRLHSRNIAKLAGVPEEYLETVADRIVKDKKIRVDHAKNVLDEILKVKSTKMDE